MEWQSQLGRLSYHCRRQNSAFIDRANSRHCRYDWRLSGRGNISRYFRDLGEAYQIANDISNYNGSDGAKLIAGDLARRAPNAVTLSFIDGLNTDEKARFNDWYHSGDTDRSCIMASAYS